jgi:hypothetical protein
MRLRVGIVVAAIAVSGLSGCGGGGPKLVAVSGTVTLNGKPFRDAELSFIPDGSNKLGLPGLDKTGPEGNYMAMTEGRRGLVPGKYKVYITRVTLDSSKVPSHFKDDPYMARLVLEPPRDGVEQRPARSTSQSSEIKGEFERDVPPEGGILDFDVKAELPKS